MKTARRTLLATALILGALASAPALAAEPDWNAINGMSRPEFVERFGAIFEKSPWVAEGAWDARPFTSLDDLHQKMVAVVKYATIDRQLSLLRSHPDLAGKEAQAGAMTASSVAEQASAGLNALSRDEVERLAGYNAEYKRKFGFPFLIAVRNHTKEGIFSLFKQRIGNDTVTELGNDLQQVYTITRLRLDKLFADL